MVKRWLLSFVLAFLCGWGLSRATADGGWGERPANLNTAEFLELRFQSQFDRPETGLLGDWAFVSFLPGARPSEAVLLLHHTWHDERVSAADLRREIRRIAESNLRLFEAECRRSVVSRRWKVEQPKDHLVVRHVRASDFSEVLAVTAGGETSFDAEKIAKAKALVVARGGTWP